MTSILINGNEGTGSVADRTVEIAKHETSGSIGARVGYGSAITDNALACDTVCFKGKDSNKKSNAGAAILGTLLGIAVAVGSLGLLHKNAGKIESDKMKKFAKDINCVTEPCYKACSWVKKNCYDKIANALKKNK